MGADDHPAAWRKVRGVVRQAHAASGVMLQHLRIVDDGAEHEGGAALRVFLFEQGVKLLEARPTPMQKPARRARITSMRVSCASLLILRYAPGGGGSQQRLCGAALGEVRKVQGRGIGCKLGDVRCRSGQRLPVLAAEQGVPERADAREAFGVAGRKARRARKARGVPSNSRTRRMWVSAASASSSAVRGQSRDRRGCRAGGGRSWGR